MGLTTRVSALLVGLLTVSNQPPAHSRSLFYGLILNYETNTTHYQILGY